MLELIYTKSGKKAIQLLPKKYLKSAVEVKSFNEIPDLLPYDVEWKDIAGVKEYLGSKKSIYDYLTKGSSCDTFFIHVWRGLLKRKKR